MAESHQPDDESFLDDLFDRAVEILREGESIDLDELLGERGDLRGSAEEAIRLARELAVRPTSMLPVVAGYDLIDELGRGAGGTVYLALQQALGGRRVALKVMSPAAFLSRRARRQFLDEARALASVRHPGVVAIHDVVEQDGLCAYAMEWVEGETLDAVLARGVRAPHGQEPPGGGSFVPWICALGMRLARALGEVHEQGLLHRDVKPSNIMVRPDGSPVLIDFGLARERESASRTRTGLFAGTPAYAAPEQLRGEQGELDGRADLYGLGVTLYEALSGRRPFDGATTAALLARIEEGVAPPLRRIDPRLPRDLETVVAHAMEPLRRDRYGSAEEMADDLERLLGLRPIHARPAALPTRVLKWGKRNRATLFGILVGLVVTLLAGALLYHQLVRIPRQAQRILLEARLSLLNPAFANRVQEWHVSPDHLPDQRFMVFFSTRIDRSLALFDRAVEFGVDDSGRALLERDVVAVARDLASGRTPENVALRGDDRSRSFIADLARRWPDAVERAFLYEELSEEGVDEDLRYAGGLLAFLLGDPAACSSSWSYLEERLELEPFLDAALGLQYQVMHEPDRAYARLDRAARAYPAEGQLLQALSRAALQCSDVERARRLLLRVGELGYQDTFDERIRLEADLLVLDGELESALEKYDWMHRNHRNVASDVSFAILLARTANPQRAMRILDRSVERWRGGPPEHRRLLGQLVELTWTAHDRVGRARLLRSTFGADGVALIGGFGHAFVASLPVAERHVRRDGHRRPFLWTPFGPLDPDFDILGRPPSSPFGRGISVRDSAFLKEIMTMDRKWLRWLDTDSKELLADWMIRSVESPELRRLNESGTGRTGLRRAARLAVLVLSGVSLFHPDLVAQIQFDCSASIDPVDGSYDVVAADFDGDGDVDLGGGEYLGSASRAWIAWNDGAGQFTSILRVPTGHYSVGVASVDLDRNGDLDLVLAANAASGFVDVLMNPASASPTTTSVPSGTTRVLDVAAGDLDGDDWPDVIVTTDLSNTVELFRNNGAGGLVWHSSHTASGRAVACALDDVDRDGNLDIVVGGNTLVDVFLGNGTGGFAAPFSVDVLTSSWDVILADFNGDDYPDLATNNSSANSVRVALNLGAGGPGFGPVSSVVVGDNAGLVAADFDLDGDQDIAVCRESAGDFSVLENDGTGVFSVSGSFCSVSSGIRWLDAADFDGDGDMDLAIADTAHPGTQDISITLNQTPTFWTYGSGCPTFVGVPSLAGSGTPCAGCSVTLDVAGGPTNLAIAFLFASYSRDEVPVSGCVLHVGFPLAGLMSLPLDVTGSLSVPVTIPPGTPSTNVYLQVFILDGGAPNGKYGATNGLRMGTG